MNDSIANESQKYPPLNVISLYAENVKTVRAVFLDLEGKTMFSIGGKNGAGKSTMLQCLMMSLMGGRVIPEDPIRHGERHAQVRTILGHNGDPVLTIELDLSVASKPRLVVKDATGSPIATPQTVLNTLYEHIGFDPLEFSKFDETKQRDIICRLVGLDFTEDDKQMAAATEARKKANSSVKEYDAKFKGMPTHKGVPAVETSVSDVLAELKAARAHNEVRKAALSTVGTARGKVSAAEKLVVDLEKELAEARDALVAQRKNQTDAESALSALAPANDTDALEKKAEEAEQTNQKVRANAARAEVEKKIREFETEAAKHDKQITDIKASRVKAISAAKFPVPELSFTVDGELLFNGSLLKEASAGQKLRLSVAIAIALNPTMKCITIQQGNLLDKASMTMIRDMAADAGVQVLMEMVSEDGAGCSVYIEAGELVETASAAE